MFIYFPPFFGGLELQDRGKRQLDHNMRPAIWRAIQVLIASRYPAAVRHRHRTDKREASPCPFDIRAFHKPVRPSLPHFLMADERSMNKSSSSPHFHGATRERARLV
jgi:hypothetical protein